MHLSSRIATHLFGAFLLNLLIAPAAWSQVTLTFDDDGTVSNFDNINPAYGDRVVSSPDSNGLFYGVAGAGAPNVVVSYDDDQPRLWTTGYGDLENVYFDDLDGDDSLTLTLTADPGFEAGLLSFEIATFGNDQFFGSIFISGSDGNLFGISNLLVAGSGHTDIDISTFFAQDTIWAQEIELLIDLGGLGGASDNIGIDNVVFTQRAIPEPTSLALLVSLMGFGTIRLGNRITATA